MPALALLTQWKTALGLPLTDPAPDAKLQQYLDFATGTAQRYTKRDLIEQTYTDYFSGNGQRDLVLNHRPVSDVANVYLDFKGYFGQGANAFPASTALRRGSDWILKCDKGTISNAGLLRRIGGIGQGAFVGSFMETYYTGTLAARRMPIWPCGDGNLKVVYTAGFSDTPPDITAAILEIASWMKRYLPVGAFMTNESLANYSYGLQVLTGTPELGSVRQILNCYREVSI